MADKKNFKVIGKVDGKHQVEMEEGNILLLDNSELAEHQSRHNQLTSNDKWPNRPEAAYVSPFPGETGSVTPVLLAFSDLKQAFGALNEQNKTLLENQLALEGRIVELENAQDEKVKVPEKKNG